MDSRYSWLWLCPHLNEASTRHQGLAPMKIKKPIQFEHDSTYCCFFVPHYVLICVSDRDQRFHFFKTIFKMAHRRSHLIIIITERILWPQSEQRENTRRPHTVPTEKKARVSGLIMEKRVILSQLNKYHQISLHLCPYSPWCTLLPPLYPSSTIWLPDFFLELPWRAKLVGERKD